ncbi:hypothetical protein SARC_01919 [Sphaeroforma arctica JP610]|uniref:Spindle pole body component n=1 Tax=Sphaeroforma arctica JP610 TaxID=667725 RepID=A0A0L0GA66_9EUKA|nr:hypothetical protein SARC_01919 [Sphaeroforma arctica JP610]KNC85927.1 hypothetical protein SARC_01919 [Sphaeroforma arctica JP610]|eukprot:XP_014159829.1 hypothetical protein SARC_01919 [Sphaeroforma arctica JP610]
MRQYYLMVEVIEASSETLRKSMQKAKDLDQVIDAHNKFLSEVVTNSLLGDVTSELFAMIKTIAGNILGFCQFLENFRAVATQEHTTRQQAETDRIERGSRGEWATSRKDTAAEEEKMAVFSQDIKRFSSKVSRFNNNFRSRAKILVELLNESQSPSMRSLATRLDFSGYFSSVKQSADGFQSYSDAQ